MLRPKIITPADGHVLTIETCRQHLELVAIDGNSDGETHPDDALILAMLDAAVEHAEDFTGRSIAIRTYEVALDEFPESDEIIELPNPPLIELVSVQGGDGTDAVDLDADLYLLDTYGEVSSLRAVTEWPLVTESPNTVKIRYRAGYSSEGVGDSDAQALPASIRAAILLLMGHLYENREDSTEKAMSAIPSGFEALLRPKRVRFGMA